MRLTIAVLALTVAAPSALHAQSIAGRYNRAAAMLPSNVQALISGNQLDPRWFDGDRFWFRGARGLGGEFIVVDPVRGSRGLAFDHARLAAALSIAADTAYTGERLPFTEFDFSRDGRSIQFQVADSTRFTCDVTTYKCTGPEKAFGPARDEILSPDGKWAAFSRNENLWVRNVATKQETQLSSDGEQDWGYAVVPEGCCSEITTRRAKRKVWPVLRWSPDSRRIATHRYDERRVEQLHLLETVPGKRPKLHSYHYALPGDSVIPTWDAYVFDVESKRGTKLEIPPIPGNFTGADSSFEDVQWTKDGASLFVAARSRDFRTWQLYQADPNTGKARVVYTESGKTYRELNQLNVGPPNWRPLKNGREIIWWSERDGWGHLYRIDATNGQVLNQVTSGAWMVLDLLSVDEVTGTVHFTAVGREAGVDPYYRHLYKVGLDGSALTRLSTESADHQVWAAPSGKYFVDLYSRRDIAPVAVVRAPDGRVTQTIETGDIARLRGAGWKAPMPYAAKGRDGVTDVYGYLYLPTDFDSNATYPVVDYIYPGPQIGAVYTRSFTSSAPGDPQALAELGFIVFTVDAFGSPLRSKAFHDAYYGNMTDNGLADHISAIRELAVRHRQMDLGRVGIYGHSGGGFSGTDAILRYPEFYKVAVSGAGNHDQRGYHFPWGEKYHGLMEVKNGVNNYDSQANQNLAANLKGKLLLSYGTLDDNVHPDMTLAVIDALIRANKKFDVFVYPNRNHGYAAEPYAIQQMWDYFVRYLREEAPPEDFILRRR